MEFHRKIHIKATQADSALVHQTDDSRDGNVSMFSWKSPADWLACGIWKVAVNHFKEHVCLFYANINARNRRRYAQPMLNVNVSLSTVAGISQHYWWLAITQGTSLYIFIAMWLFIRWSEGWNVIWWSGLLGVNLGQEREEAGCDVPFRRNIFTDDIKIPFQLNG